MFCTSITVFITALVAVCLLAAPVGTLGAAEAEDATGPRKVVIATSVFGGVWRAYPGLDQRLEELGRLVDRSAAEAHERYDRGLDLLVLTEYAVNAGRRGSPAQRALDFEGPVREYFAAKAREHACYIVLPMILAEDRERGIYTNSSILIGRDGEPVGIYRKLFPVASRSAEDLEGGIAPGREAPVFECDFGRVGMQICYDMSFDQGWDELAAQGAEIVAWSSASPQTFMPALRARRGGYHVVSATPRDNASVYDPLGQVVDRVTPTDADQEPPILVTQVDLAYLAIDWQPGLRDGEVFAQAYGDRVGFRYSSTEDIGLFWSNDPEIPIATMLRELGLDPRYPDWPGHTLRLREQALEDAPPLPDFPGDAGH